MVFGGLRIGLAVIAVVAGIGCTAPSMSGEEGGRSSEAVAEPIDGRATMKSMGPGFNLGNTFDLNLNPTDLADIRKVVDLYVGAGAKHVRIPVTWMDGFEGDHLADGYGNVKVAHSRLKNLKLAVDYAVGKGLHVVINTHHEHWLKSRYNGAEHDKVFGRLWTGIATEFKDADSKVIFEVLNEPDGVFGDWSGGAKPDAPEALRLTRHINQVGYDAIRATGGKNSTRIVMVGMNGMGNHSMFDDLYPTADRLPGGGKDPNLVVTVHTYDPWGFCGQDGKTSAYPGAKAVRTSIQAVLDHGAKLGVGLNYGEFGVGRQVNQSERNTTEVKEYYEVVAKTVKAAGMSFTPWDDRGWFGLIEKSGDGYQFKYGLFPSMVK